MRTNGMLSASDDLSTAILDCSKSGFDGSEDGWLLEEDESSASRSSALMVRACRTATFSEVVWLV